MKIYIRASDSNKTLTLSKGIYFDYYAIPLDKAEEYKKEYREFFVDNNNVYGFLFISEAEYDTVTGELSNNLLNHDQLIAKYHLEFVPTDKLTYFRIDLNRSKTGTELTTSGVHNFRLNEYLSKLFNVSISDDALSDNWISCDNPDFVSEFKQAAARCQQYIYDLKKNSTTDLSDYSRPDYFAFCFAVIDPDTNSALISDSSNGILFASPSYSSYLNDTKKLAKELGKSSPKQLSFKTLYYKYLEENKDLPGPGTEYSNLNLARSIIGQLAHKYPKIIKIENLKEREFSFNNKKDFVIIVKSNVPEPELYQIGTDYFQITLPQDFKADEANLKMLYKLMNNA